MPTPPIELKSRAPPAAGSPDCPEPPAPLAPAVPELPPPPRGASEPEEPAAGSLEALAVEPDPSAADLLPPGAAKPWPPISPTSLKSRDGPCCEPPDGDAGSVFSPGPLEDSEAAGEVDCSIRPSKISGSGAASSDPAAISARATQQSGHRRCGRALGLCRSTNVRDIQLRVFEAELWRRP